MAFNAAMATGAVLQTWLENGLGAIGGGRMELVSVGAGGTGFTVVVPGNRTREEEGLRTYAFTVLGWASR